MVFFLVILHVKLQRICRNSDIKTDWLRDQKSILCYICHSPKIAANNKASLLRVKLTVNCSLGGFLDSYASELNILFMVTAPLILGWGALKLSDQNIWGEGGT